MAQDFRGGPVVQNLLFNTGDKGSIPDQGTKILHATGQLSPHSNERSLNAAKKTQSSQKNKNPKGLEMELVEASTNLSLFAKQWH